MKIIGHRGARGLAPENTLEGLRVALQHQLDGIEFDVRITRDGIAVLSHDDSLELTDRSELSIHAHNYAVLLAGRPQLCTLMSALRTINRRATSFIEIKAGSDPEPIITDIRRLMVEGWQPQDLAVLSFDFAILKQVHTALPEIPIIVNEMWSSVRAVSRAKRLDTTQIDIFSWWLWPGVIRGLSKRGYKLFTFPLNNPAKAQRWQSYGLYGIVTDHPDRMRALSSTTPKDA